ncbi:MAG: hypothetical protein KQJ78_10570 [Deltaproteobacteria bacterium]|nr:hypothetical protein [Deltaproteobacteria bacterium]
MRVKALLLTLGLVFILAGPAWAWRVGESKTVPGFGHPESVAYDPQAKVLYVSRFGPELQPTLKDGKGFISKLDLHGKILEERFLPAGKDVLNKPKGLWVRGDRLYVTDIDAVWIFDLGSREGSKVDLPGAKFANDVMVWDDFVWVSDTDTDSVVKVEPIDFLHKKAKVWDHLRSPGLTPNGLYPGEDKFLLATMAKGGYPGQVLEMGIRQSPRVVFNDLGRLDGLGSLSDGAILFTDWSTGSLYLGTPGAMPKAIAEGFKGPADFGLVPDGEDYVIVVPDLVTGDLRFIELDK